MSIFDEVTGRYRAPRLDDLPPPPEPSIWRSAQQGLSDFMDSPWGAAAEVPLTVVTAPQRAVESVIGAFRGGFKLSDAEREAYGREAYDRDAAVKRFDGGESAFETAARRLRGRAYTAPTGGQIARETVAGAGELVGAPSAATVMGLSRDPAEAGGYRPIAESEQARFEQESPVLSRAAAPLRVATEFAGSLATDPTSLLAFGPKLAAKAGGTIAKEAAEGALRSAALETAKAERLASRLFVPGAVTGAVGGTLEAGRAISEEGWTSPGAIEAALGATVAVGMGALAGHGALRELDSLPKPPPQELKWYGFDEPQAKTAEPAGKVATPPRPDSPAPADPTPAPRDSETLQPNIRTADSATFRLGNVSLVVSRRDDGRYVARYQFPRDPEGRFVVEGGPRGTTSWTSEADAVAAAQRVLPEVLRDRNGPPTQSAPVPPRSLEDLPPPPEPLRPFDTPNEPDRYAYRARTVGEQGIPATGHAQASLSEQDVRRMAPSRTEEPQEVARVDLKGLDPSKFEIHETPSGEKWVRFKENLPEEAVEKLGPIDAIDRAAADKATPPVRAAVESADIADLAQATGLSLERAAKGADDVRADGVRELSPEAVAIKKTVLQSDPAMLEPEVKPVDLRADPTDPLSPEPSPEPRAATPDRRAKVQRGQNGAVDIEFETPQDKELFSALGRFKRGMRGEPGRSPNFDGLGRQYGTDATTAMRVAQEYRQRVMDAVRDLPEGEVFRAPRPEFGPRQDAPPAPKAPAVQRLPTPPKDPAGNPILPGQESWTPEERAVVHTTAKAIVGDVVAGQKLQPTGRAPILGGVARNSVEGYIGTNSPKSGTPLEALPYTPSQMKAAIERDKGNPIELDIHEAIRGDERVVERLADAGDAGGEDASFDFGANAKYSVRPVPGQRGIEGIGRDVERAGERPRSPEQARMFGGEMLQGVEARTTEGREASGPIFQRPEAQPEQRTLNRLELDIERAGRHGGDYYGAEKGEPGSYPLDRARAELDAAMRSVYRGTPEGAAAGERLRMLRDRLDETRTFDLTEAEARSVRSAIARAREHPRPEQYSTKPVAADTAPAVNVDNVRRAFPTGKITENEGAWDVRLPGNRNIRVTPTGDVEFSLGDLTRGHPEAVEGGALKPGQRVVGSWQRIGRGGLISLAKEAGQGTLDHETFHAAMELVLSERERKAVMKRFGNEERAADAYGAWTPADKSNAVFAKLAQFFQRLYRNLFPNAESVFGKIRSGEAFNREGTPYPDVPLPARAQATERNRQQAGPFPTNYREFLDSGLDEATAPEPPPVTGRRVLPGESPRVEHRVDDLAAATADAGIPEEPLKRDTPQSWESLDPKVQEVLRTYDDQKFYDIMSRRNLDAVETQAFDAVIKGKSERLEKLKQQERTPETDAQITADTLDYIAAQRAYVNDGTGLARALAARARVMSAARPVEAFSRRLEAFRVTPQMAGEVLTAIRRDPTLLDLIRSEARALRLSVKDAMGGRNPQIDTPEFKRWFGESRAVDANGAPVVVFHGAPDARFVSQDGVFRSPANRFSSSSDTSGAFWFAADERAASTYADDTRAFDYQNADPGVIPAYLSIKNPMVIDAQGKVWRDAQHRGKSTDIINAAKAAGNDGVIIRNVRDDYNNRAGGKATDTYVVFDAKQIKSATQNSGTFDPKNPDIRYSVEAISKLSDRLKGLGLSDEQSNAFVKALREDSGFLPELEAAVKNEPAEPADVLLKKVFREIKGVSDEQAAEILTAFKENPDNLGPLLQSALGAGKVRKALEWWRAGLLSSFSTDAANVSGNIAEHHIRLAETGVASALDWMLQKVYGGDRARFAGEVGAEMAGANMAFGPALKNLARNLKDVATLKDKPLDLSRKLEGQFGAIGGTTGKVVRAIGFGRMGAEDVFFKEWGGGAEAMKLAYRKAANSLPAGTSKAEIRTRAKQIIEELADPENTSHADIAAEVEKAKDYRTFQERRVGSLTDALSGVVRRNPMLSFVAPFVNTPGNIANAIIRRSPLGARQAMKAFGEFKKAQADFAAGKIDQAAFSAARGKLADAITGPLLGTAMLAGFTLYANAGGMTGSGPTDDRAKNALRESGWSPYSFVFTDPTSGKKVYIPFNRFEPVSSLLGFAADMAEAKNVRNLSLFDKALGSVVENLTSKSYLTGLSDAASLITKPKEFAPQYIKGFVGSWVPNIVGRTAAAIDPIQRDTRASKGGFAGLPEAISKNLQSRIPFASKALPARVSSTGAPVERPGNALTRFASPVQPTIEKPERFLEEEYGRLGWAPTAPSRGVTVKGIKTNLTDDEFTVMTKASRRASDEARNLIRSAHYKSLPDDQRELLLDRIYSKWKARGRQSIRAKLERRVAREARA